MRCAGLFVLAILLTVPLFAAPAEQPAPETNWPAWSSDGMALPPQMEGWSSAPTPRFDFEASDSTTGVCYKIRAYIFKADDDHAPEMKGSTTCQPRQAHLKAVIRPKARVVPAD